VLENKLRRRLFDAIPDHPIPGSAAAALLVAWRTCRRARCLPMLPPRSRHRRSQSFTRGKKNAAVQGKQPSPRRPLRREGSIQPSDQGRLYCGTATPPVACMWVCLLGPNTAGDANSTKAYQSARGRAQLAPAGRRARGCDNRGRKPSCNARWDSARLLRPAPCQCESLVGLRHPGYEKRRQRKTGGTGPENPCVSPNNYFTVGCVPERLQATLMGASRQCATKLGSTGSTIFGLARRNPRRNCRSPATWRR